MCTSTAQCALAETLKGFKLLSWNDPMYSPTIAVIILQLNRSSFRCLIVNTIHFDQNIFFSGIKLNVTVNNEP